MEDLPPAEAKRQPECHRNFASGCRSERKHSEMASLTEAATANGIFARLRLKPGRERPVRHWHTVCIIPARNDLIRDFATDEQLALQALREIACSSPQSSTVIKSKTAATTVLRTRTRFRPPKIRLHCRLGECFLVNALI